MKCSLLFALSHEPTLIIMDEPTAGLDPIFRKELLQTLQQLMLREDQTIFLSTHITTDLDKIADHVIIMNDGNVLLQQSMNEINETYHLVKGKNDLLDEDVRGLFEHVEQTNTNFQALFKGNPAIFEPFYEDVVIERATLDDLMYFLIKGENHDVATHKA